MFAYSFVVSLILGFALHKTIGLRVTADAEVEGIDSTEHSETAYDWGRLAGSLRTGPVGRLRHGRPGEVRGRRF